MAIKFKRIYFFLFSIFNILPSFTQDINFEWVKTIGGIASQFDSYITTDEEGNVYSIGQYRNTTDFDPGPNIYNLHSATTSLYIQKLDSNGNLIWVKSIGNNSDDYETLIVGTQIIIDEFGDILITGTYLHVVDFDPGPAVYNLGEVDKIGTFLLKLDTDGNFIWVKNITNLTNYSSVEFMSIDYDSDNNIYLAGSFSNSTDFNPGSGTHYLQANGSKDIFILKLNPAGNFIWVKQMGGIDYDLGYSLSVGTDDNVYITGSFSDSVDFNTTSGLPFIVSGDYDMFVLKLNTNGNTIWAKQMKADIRIVGYHLALDEFNNIYITGKFKGTADLDPNAGIYNLVSNGEYDAFIQKLSSNGDLLWAKQIGGVDDDEGLGIATKNGKVYTVGSFKGIADFNPNIGVLNLETYDEYSDGFIQSLDSAGNFLWVNHINGEFIDQARAITIDPFHNIYTTGIYFDDINFQINYLDSNILSTGSSDVFILKLSIPEPIHNEEISKNQSLNIYPNPSNNIFNLSLNKTEPYIELTINDIYGNIISNTFYEQISQTSINLRNHPSGMYFLTIKLNNGQTTVPLIKR